MSSVFKLNNPHLNENDYLYHLGLRVSDDLPSQYGDVKFVWIGGKSSRMESFAIKLYRRMGHPTNSLLDKNNKLRDLAADAGRYSMFKVGEVLIVSHGIGMASLTVVFNEVLKLLHYAKCSKDVKVIRTGTSGGLGVDPGTLILTIQPFNDSLEVEFKRVSLGETHSMPCPTSEKMRLCLLEQAKALELPAVSGNTMSANDFYEGQCRLDGAFCDYKSEDKMNFLKKAHADYGIINIEMESACLAAMCNRANIECAVVCIAVVDRLKGDIVDITESQVNTWQDQLFQVIGNYILQSLGRT